MNKNVVLGIVGGVVLLALVFRKDLKAAGSAVGGFIVNPNEGTDFEGTGVVGTVGNVVDQASGGFFSAVGSFLARQLDPNEDKSLDELTAQPASKIGVKGTKDGNIKLGDG